MTGHVPFDAKSDWANPYCGNQSNDPLVDKMLGNAYHVVRTVYCNLGNLELLYDFLTSKGMVVGVQSEPELKALPKEFAKFARLYNFANTGDRQVTDYLYVADDTSGIKPNDPELTGSWVKVATSGSTGGGQAGGQGAYIPYVYQNGSATGGETSFFVPDGTQGVPFLVVNGSMQYVGHGFEYNSANGLVTLSYALAPGDEVVALTTAVPANPDNPEVTGWVQVNWLYNNGSAVGGEQVITIPYNFYDIPAVFVNGKRYYRNLSSESYTFDKASRTLVMTEILAQGDRVIVTLGGESSTIPITDRTVEEVSRSLNIKADDLVLSSTTHLVITGKKYLYDTLGEKYFVLPDLPPNAYIVSVSGDQLTYNPGAVKVTMPQAKVTPESLERVLNRLAAESGNPSVGSFEKGATVTAANQSVSYLATGRFYRWNGSYPKTVPAKTVPTNIGTDWTDITESTLRSQLVNGEFEYSDATSVYAVPGIVINTTTDNRNAAYAHGKRIYIPAGVTIRVNLLPDDDVRKFVGEGKLIVKNQWYNTDLTFDVKQSTHGNGISAKDYIVGGIKRQTHTSIGIVGDSISDGAWGKQNWTSPPLDGNRDMLAPQAYNHGLSGGSHAWCAHWQWLMNMVQSRYSADAIYQVFNVSLSGAKLSDGWGYRNFDRGFFGNSTYGSKAPQVCILAMGWNDSGTNLDTYRDQIDMFVRKAWGYGCAVGIITMHDNDPDRIGFEATTKRQMASKLGIDYFDMGDEITRMSNENATSHSLYYMKKEPQYDTTHPQELGQMVMGNSIFMQTLGEKFVMRVRPGDQMNAGTVERWWDAVTYPSSKHLTPSYGRASGSAKLDLFGYLPMGNTAGENVSLNTFIYCEEEGMSLTLLEPWTGNSVVGSNNHMTVQCPAGIGLNEADTTYAARNIKINSYRMLAKGQVASKYIGGSATLTTYAGRLRKGLNQITYVNGANAPNIWYPSLKFGSVYTDGIRLKPTRLSVEQTPVPRMFVPADDKFTDKVITNVMSGRAYSQVPNGFVAQGSLVGQIRCRTGLTAGTYVACNLDTVMSTAILIGIAADGKLGVGTWNRAVPTDWTYFGTALANKPFTIWVYTSTTTGEYQFSVVTDDGTVNQSVKATLVATGGGIGVYNTNSASQTVELEANFDIVREV